MNKYLLIPILLIATALTASAHCGTCGTNSGHDETAEGSACAVDCVKACCSKDADCCSKGTDCCKKDAKCTVDDCDKPNCDNAECAKETKGQSKQAKKACCPAS